MMTQEKCSEMDLHNEHDLACILKNFFTRGQSSHLFVLGVKMRFYNKINVLQM